MNTTSNLVTINEATDELFTTSEAIAAGSENEHKNVLELIRTYQSDLEDFGGVAFETRTLKTKGGDQETVFAILNEHQATLILTYMKNTKIIRDFKKRLVKAFFELTKQRAMQVPKNFSEALILAGQQQAALEEQRLKIVQAIPKVKFHDAVADTSIIDRIGIVCKALNWGRNKFFEQLRADNILMDNNVPYQQYIDQGYFDVKLGTPRKIRSANGTVYEYENHITVVTGEGVIWLKGKYMPTRILPDCFED